MALSTGGFVRARISLIVLSVIAATIGWPPADAAAQQGQRTAPEPAPSTGFRVCNKTGGPVEVAKALNTAKQGETPVIVSEGWYQFAPGECSTLWAGELKYRYYLLYAQNKNTKREWKGDIRVCVSREPFTITHGYCETSNYQRGFFQVDTGESTSWTQNLTD
jgi:uncharacterized membrane protein